MIDDNSSVGVIMKTLNTNPFTYFLFHPERCHYTNSMSIYRAIRKKVFDRYYGMNLLKKEKKNKNAFTGCETPLEIFHKERTVKFNIAREVSDN